ncbi:MAG: RDD family protein [Campylobacterota bacterium]|nr:RDD family protein [Campylobacterota bacterium]
MSESSSYPIASNPKRLTAFMIDDIVISLLFFIVFYDQFSELFSAITVVDEATLLTINMFISQHIVTVFLMKLLYHTVFVWQNGMTLGKYIMKIKVIDLQTGDTPDFQKALLRGSVRLISEVLFYIGFMMAFFMPMKQTLHDKLSACVVVDA